MIVLHELSVREQHLPQVHQLGDVRSVQLGLLSVVGLHEVPILQQEDGAFDAIAGGHRSGLARPFDLDLGAHCQKIVQSEHGGRADSQGRQAGGPSPTVAKAEASHSGGVTEDRASGDHVLEELGVGNDLLGGRIVALVMPLLPGHVLVDELPTVDAQLLGVLLDLGSLQAHALGDDQAGAAAHLVRLDPRQVPEPRDLHILGPLAVHADRTAPSDDLDLLIPRGILKMLALLV